MAMLSKGKPFKFAPNTGLKGANMTWQQFKKMALRLNLVVLIGGWLAFWGYGVLVGDIPPLSVIQGLLALSLIAIIAVTVIFFVGCRVYLAFSKTFENPNKLSAVSRYAVIGIVAAIIASSIGSSADLIPFWDVVFAIITIGVGLPCLAILLFVSPLEIYRNVTLWPLEATENA